MSIDYTKAAYISPKQNLKITQSGTDTQDVSGTYTTGTLATKTLATGVDVSNKFVFGFTTNNRNDSTQPYENLANSFSCIATVLGSPTSVFTDVYLYVNASQSLILVYKNVSFAGAFPITTPAFLGTAWYICDVPSAS